MHVSYTEIKTFRTCRLKWYYHYVLGLRPKTPRPPDDPLEFGKRVHEALAKFYTLAPSHNVDASDFVTQDDDANLFAVLKRYQTDVLPADLQRWEVLSAENTLRVQVPSFYIDFVGVIDLIAYDRERQLDLLVEHKTRKRFDSPQWIELNEQLTAYAWLATKAGIVNRPFYLVFNQIKKDTRAREFVRRNETLRVDSELQVFEDDLKLTVEEMLEIRNGDRALYPNRTYLCIMHKCDYRALCRARAQRADVEAVKDAFYYVKEDEHA